mgnify:FL=1
MTSIRISANATIGKAVPFTDFGRRIADLEKKTCPYCGFLAHLVTKSGGIATYCCERCHKLFKVSID